jgi:transposase
MKKDTTKLTIGIDLGDKYSHICILNSDSTIHQQCAIRTIKSHFQSFFTPYSGATVALEAGTHSSWTSHMLDALGLTVYVAHPSKVRAIWKTDFKDDERDAIMLAQIAQFNPKMLHPITHRSHDTQMDLAVIKARDALIRTRTGLINHIRGTIKQFGLRIQSCSAPAFAKQFNLQIDEIPEMLIPAFLPLVKFIDELSEQIRSYDKQIARLCQTKYPETEALRQIKGVGPVTALAFVLFIESPERFPDHRRVGAFLGLVPRRDQSGSVDKQLRITKAGNPYLRRLLVGCVHYIMGPNGPESDLKIFGEKLCERGGKNAKKRAVVAVARKLSVLMLALWSTGEVYEPLRHHKKGA